MLGIIQKILIIKSPSLEFLKVSNVWQVVEEGTNSSYVGGVRDKEGHTPRNMHNKRH